MCDKKITSKKNIADLWVQELKSEGYEPPVIRSANSLKKLSRTWKKIFTFIQRGDISSVLEFGCGGGAHLIPLAANGIDCVGVDISDEVILRAKKYLRNSLESGISHMGKVSFLQGDFLEINFTDNFDMVFNFGVIEHFIDYDDRLTYLKKMFELTGKGGYVVSVVPSGNHPYRAEQRKLGLGGYKIPEVDYTRDMLFQELKICGGAEIKIIPHNFYGYLLISNNPKIWKKIIYYFFQLPIMTLLPVSFLDKHAFCYIAIAKKI